MNIYPQSRWLVFFWAAVSFLLLFFFLFFFFLLNTLIIWQKKQGIGAITIPAGNLLQAIPCLFLTACQNNQCSKNQPVYRGITLIIKQLLRNNISMQVNLHDYKQVRYD
jgi:hypothetical protein